MTTSLELWEIPKAKEIYMIAGWQQWADAGSISSGLPRYLIQLTQARQIGQILPDDFYQFQFPGTHDLVRPIVRFEEGFPASLDVPKNEFYYTEINQRGLVIFIGHEPHQQVERYVSALLEAAGQLGAKRIISLGGVYGELPYDKERIVSSIYSLPELKNELVKYAINLSDYHGGASIGSYLCKRASERNLEMIGFYGFVPTYDFSDVAGIGNTIQIENDFMAWVGLMRRINHMLKLDFDLADLEKRSAKLVDLMEEKISALDKAAPQYGVKAYFTRLSEEFNEVVFEVLDDIWEDEIRRLLDKFDQDQN